MKKTLTTLLLTGMGLLASGCQVVDTPQGYKNFATDTITGRNDGPFFYSEEVSNGVKYRVKRDKNGVIVGDPQPMNLPGSNNYQQPAQSNTKTAVLDFDKIVGERGAVCSKLTNIKVITKEGVTIKTNEFLLEGTLAKTTTYRDVHKDQIEMLPYIEDKFAAGYWKDNGDGIYNELECSEMSGTIDLERILSEGKQVLMKSGFGTLGKGLTLKTILKNSRGNIVSEQDTKIEEGLPLGVGQDKNNKFYYFMPLTVLQPEVIINDAKNNGITGKQSYEFSYLLEGQVINKKTLEFSLH